MDKPRAIPTEFDGTLFRSRFEADTAWAMKLLGFQFRYESRSFLLGNGIHYRPDFWLPSLRAWIECRGWRYRYGEEQITAFAEQVPPGETYIVIIPGEAAEVAGHPSGLPRAIAVAWKDHVTCGVNRLRRVVQPTAMPLAFTDIASLLGPAAERYREAHAKTDQAYKTVVESLEQIDATCLDLWRACEHPDQFTQACAQLVEPLRRYQTAMVEFSDIRPSVERRLSLPADNCFWRGMLARLIVWTVDIRDDVNSRDS